MRDLHNLDDGLPVLDVAALPTLPGATVQTADAKRVRRLARKFERRRFVRLQEHAIAREHLNPLPAENETIHGVMTGSYSAWSLAVATIELLAVPVEQMTIGTLGFSRTNCDELLAFVDAGRIQSVLLMVSDFFRSSDRTIYADIRRDFEARGQLIRVSRSHAKLLLFAAGERRITVETSSNLRSSHNHEQFSVHSSPEVYDFHREWMLDLIAQEEAKCHPKQIPASS